jgi:hypothetical protein
LDENNRRQRPDTHSMKMHDEAPTLITLRSNDQFNTAIIGFSDRFGGLERSRDILLINPEDMRQARPCRVPDRVCRIRDRRRLPAGRGWMDDHTMRLSEWLRGGVLSRGEPLVPLGYHDELSHTPAAKGVPVRFIV